MAGGVALLPRGAKRVLLRHFRRPLLWTLFRLEPEKLTIARVGGRYERFPMRVHWQGNLDYVLGTYEPEVSECLAQLVKPGSCCLDVGAHLGYFTILMARRAGPEGLVVGFEPFPRNLEALRENIQLNRLTNVRLEPVALGEREGEVSLIHEGNGMFSATASEEAYAVQGSRAQVRVAMRCLDDCVAELGRTPHVIKADVEGAELAVLRGGRATLRKARPALVIEIHAWGTPKADEVVQLLRDYGYEVTLLGTKGREANLLCRAVAAPVAAPAPGPAGSVVRASHNC
jgi:FkbM family methyltransferase